MGIPMLHATVRLLSFIHDIERSFVEGLGFSLNGHTVIALAVIAA